MQCNSSHVRATSDVCFSDVSLESSFLHRFSFTPLRVLRIGYCRLCRCTVPASENPHLPMWIMQMDYAQTWFRAHMSDTKVAFVSPTEYHGSAPFHSHSQPENCSAVHPLKFNYCFDMSIALVALSRMDLSYRRLWSVRDRTPLDKLRGLANRVANRVIDTRRMDTHERLLSKAGSVKMLAFHNLDLSLCMLDESLHINARHDAMWK